MIELLMDNQMRLMISMGILCLFLSLFIIVIKFQSITKKISLIEIEICTALVVFADAFDMYLEGQQGDFAFYAIRIANFIIFAGISMDMYFLNLFISDNFMSSGKFKKLPKRLFLGFILPPVDVLLIIISQFTHIFYYFDENNNYVRGPLYSFSYVIPVVVIVLLFSFLVEKRKMITKRLFAASTFFVLIFIVAGILQFFVGGVTWVNLATGIAAVVMFVLALSDQNSILMKAANTEINTGLPNASGYIREVDTIMRTHDITDYNAYYFDISGMGRLNNKYGKDKGDEIIFNYAHYIRRNLEKDEVVGRLGGNFFVALVKKAHTDSFLAMMNDVPVEVKTPEGKETIHISAVAGGYTITNKRIHVGDIIGNAATAVSYAKANKKKVVFLDDELEAELMRRKVFEETTRKALKAKEFIPFYQPKVDIRTGKLCGAEALARWQHDGKFISPGEFVPVMEKNKSVSELDFCIFEHVCANIREWLDAGMTPPVISVNFSRTNLGNPNLAKDIKKMAEKYNVPQDLIQIEITETVDEYPMKVLVDIVESLRLFGFTVAIDDFGTGSSSICLLKEVAFDVLKIDRAFVNYANEKEKQILACIIEMALTLGINVIAEGVENDSQLQVLRTMGCREIQGFIFDKPLVKDEFEDRMLYGKEDVYQGNV